MKRTIISVSAGYLLWTGLWFGGNSLFFAAAGEVVSAGQPYTATAPLLGVIALSIVCSLAAGIAATIIGKERSRGAVRMMAALLLITGIAVQMGVWALMPLWYHLTFLGLIVPVALFGARLVGSRLA